MGGDRVDETKEAPLAGDPQQPQCSDHVHIDPRPRVWVCGDESGSLGFVGSKHFVVTTVTIHDHCIARRLAELKLSLRRQTGGRGIGAVFRGGKDTLATRGAVFDLLRHEDIDIEASYVTKSELPPQIWQRPVLLLAHLWFDHLMHALPSALAPANRVTLLIADLMSASDAEAFKIAYGAASGITWYPHAIQHLRPDGAGGLELTAPMTALLKQVPVIQFTTESAGEQRLLQVADYASWAVQRWLERGDAEGMTQLGAKISSIRKVALTLASDSAPDDSWLRSQRLIHSAMGDWQTWFRYDRGPNHSGQADCAVEGAAHCNNPQLALHYLQHVVFSQHVLNRRDTLRGYLSHLHDVLPAEQRPVVQSMLARVIATLVDTPREPERRILEAATGILTQWPRPVMDEPRVAVEEAEAGRRLCERLVRDASDPTPFSEGIVAFEYGRAMSHAKNDERRAARRAYAEVVRRTMGATDTRLRATNARAWVNLMTLLPASAFVEETLNGVITEIDLEDDALFDEPFCVASLNLAAIRSLQGRPSEEGELLRNALRRARRTQQPWVAGFVHNAEHHLSAV